METTAKKRYVSLDVLRGITVAFMCVVNNPGSWGKIYPPLEHASWIGCTPTDLVYPFFLFCVGCAMAFSFTKFDGLTGASFGKVFKRSALIFLTGFLINLYPFFPLSTVDGLSWKDSDMNIFSWIFSLDGADWLDWISYKRIFGVLQRIAMAYLIAGTLALWLRKPAKIVAAIATIFVVYTGILVAFGTDPGPFTLEGTVSRKIDVAVVGADHVYHGYRYDFDWAKAQEIEAGTYVSDNMVKTRADFDPEGPLGSLTGACTALLGFLIGSLILGSGRKWKESKEDFRNSPAGVVARIFFWGALCLGVAEIMSIWIPISKPLWSASYVLYAGGWAMVALAALAWLIDVRGVEKPFTPFKAMGMNALMAFILSGVIAKSYVFFGWSSSKYFGSSEAMSLLYALIFMSVVGSILWILYKKKIVIKF